MPSKKKPEKAVVAVRKANPDKEYNETLASLKRDIRQVQIKAATAVNKELIALYWKIGKTIAEKQEISGWGSKVVEKLAKDIQNEFPGIDGFSRRNIFRMMAFYNEYKIVPPVAAQIDEIEHLGVLAQIPWSHNIILMEKLSNIKERIWYATKTVENRWGKRALEDWIDRRIHTRQGKAITNFSLRLPESQSTLAQETLCNPYVFDFLNLPPGHLEKDLEDGLVRKSNKHCWLLDMVLPSLDVNIH
jgi:predicted nuclease of restriction endonuclease-like (RecB) superfamily